MSGLTDFLLARIAEDEVIAAAVANWDDHLVHEVGGFSANALRFVQHSTPARVLAECEAKRRIVEMHRQDEGRDWCMEGCGMRSGWVDYPCGTLKALALPYADHPDYREEWKP